MSNSIVLKFILMLSLSLLMFSACGDDDPTGPGTNELVGIWNAETNTIFYGSISSPDSTEVETFGGDVQVILTFMNENTFTLNVVVFGETIVSDSGTWSVSGNKITFKAPGEPDDTDDFSISGNKLTLTDSETIDGYTTFDVTVWTKQ